MLWARASSLCTLPLRPCFVWDPRDSSVLPALLQMIDSAHWRWVDGGPHLTASPRIVNLVHGLHLAVERDRAENPTSS